MPRSIAELTDLIAEMPGIGPRQARRVVQFLLRANPEYKKKLVKGIETLSDTIAQCSFCYRYDEINKDTLCAYCSNKNRDASSLMVVEKDVDVDGVEGAGVFKGYYFVLGSLIPLTQTRRTRVNPRVHELLTSLKKRQDLSEIILAFATTPEGDYTARELQKTIQKDFPSLKISLLGRGLSLGAEIEYADQETLRSALQGRSEKF